MAVVPPVRRRARAGGGWPLWLGVAACAACAAPPVPRDVERHLLQVVFEPPLAAPAELHYAHECGLRGAVVTACTGVDLLLPPGPVSLALHEAGATRSLAAQVARGSAPLVWR